MPNFPSPAFDVMQHLCTCSFQLGPTHSTSSVRGIWLSPKLLHGIAQKLQVWWAKFSILYTTYPQASPDEAAAGSACRNNTDAVASSPPACLAIPADSSTGRVLEFRHHMIVSIFTSHDIWIDQASATRMQRQYLIAKRVKTRTLSLSTRTFITKLLPITNTADIRCRVLACWISIAFKRHGCVSHQIYCSIRSVCIQRMQAPPAIK
jgi:hypothetical protein